LTWNRNHARGSHRPEIDEKAVDWRAFLGNAPMQPFSPQRFAHWRWYWDFGGGILTDLMVHWMDVVNWYLDLDTPTQALTVGDRFMPEWEWETPDTVQTLVRYAKEQTQVYFEGTFVNHRNRAMAEFMGRQATLYIDRGRFEIHPENGRGSYREQVLGQGERGQDFYNEPPAEVLHLSNWLECIRSRMTPRCSAEIGVKAVYASHLGNRSYRTGQVASWRS
jgi:predicted dehydrogenase